MSSEQERRRHRRYPLRLPIKLHRGEEQLDAEVINASKGGCLLLTSMPLEPGEVLHASIPELMIPRTKLYVLRCQSTPMGYMCGARFDSLHADEPSLARVSDGQAASDPHKKWLH